MADILQNGGAVLWIIGGLSVVTLALILWKIWHLARLGAYGGGAHVAAAIALGDPQSLALRSDARARLADAALRAVRDPNLPPEMAREEVGVAARAQLSQARSGLRALDLIVTIAPLLGLLGTVIGMIAAFQALQEAGVRADPATLAGGIWEALLTTAAGMGVAIPASMALTWFDSTVDRLQQAMEADATRIFTRGAGAGAA